ncbi:excinuclease ABC subunit UvrA [Anaerobiospirillum sp. NML120448]|uniref:excinuclease ABC subunit UvrA n=1 Tax=Anaerobiospirillum sp. NML120448 TaxID=2932816 RepID=UPI001FF3DA82|nr:excinuclease ABC subunit UvrA [Anaerobiospirillum sp. NML120448]MCK0513324.1 excinuclease ABC subunit UvrA [Anaerobiospirillum sp. NML120448]
MENIVVRGARTHNLKNITITIPRNQLCVVTGLSGSGKSSLAFDTLYAEGQRRYVESLSSYARQFLQLMDKPDVDSIDGLSPAISIEQKATSHNPRSTVGTITEIHDYLRLLFARIGQARCPEHGTILKAQTISQMVDQTLAYEEGTKLMIMAPVVRGRKGEHRQLLAQLAQQGFVRARIDGDICDLSDPPELKLHIKHNIEVVIDRFKVREDIKQRLAESFETALKVANGLAMIVPMDDHQEQDEIILSDQYSCPICGYSISELEPRNFSFNSPHGACPSCDGLGKQMVFAESKVVPDTNKSIEEGAIALWDKRSWSFYRLLVPICDAYGIDIYKPFKELTREQQELVLYGTPNKKPEDDHYFLGVIHYFERQAKESESESYQNLLHGLMTTKICPECHGARLKKEYCNVFVADKTLPQINEMSISDCFEFFNSIKLGTQDSQIAERILKEVRERLMFLKNVGLGYLNLARSADTLSGGEAQRIRLASQIGAGLVGVMYVLDEPSIGLHQRDNQRLLDALMHLRNLGNSVIVVEHDEDAIRQADYIIDIGPRAGVHGGQVVTAGSLEHIMQCENSLTADYLTGRKSIAIPDKRVEPKGFLTLHGCQGNNLKNISASFAVGCFNVVTGVSGSGKSTLVNDTLVPIVSKHMKNAADFDLDRAFDCKSIEGLEYFDKLICIDQSPIGRTPRSNPATYIDLFTAIRELFAQTPMSRARGYSAGRFSFNVKGGRCEACQGDGTIKVEMHFLPDVYVQCEQCQGKRYNRETLEVHYKGKSIADVLNMTVEEAYSFFEAIPKIKRKLKALIDVGLSYITLGQSALTFSGGEAQRIKLAKELSKVSTKNTLYILDEPTTGLHFHDVKQLLDMLMRLRDDGNTVIIIEHNLDVIKCADYLIDLGPEGGSGGGQIIATGTPEQVAQNPNSFTGQFLKPILQKAGRLLPPTEPQPSDAAAAQPTAAQPAEASQPQEAKKATRKGTKKSASAKKTSSSTKSKSKD